MTHIHRVSSQGHPCLTLTVGTLGPVGSHTREALHFSPAADDRAHAALILLPADAPAPANGCEWRHFALNGDLPLLVLSGARNGVCHHFVVNLFDSSTRAAFEVALSGRQLDVLMSAPNGGACEAGLSLSTSEREAALSVLRRYRRAQSDDCNSWWVRMLPAANEMPHQLAQLDSRFAGDARHCVTFLNRDPGVHHSAIEFAICRAVSPRG